MNNVSFYKDGSFIISLLFIRGSNITRKTIGNKKYESSLYLNKEFARACFGEIHHMHIIKGSERSS